MAGSALKSAAEPFESFPEFPAGVEMTLRKDTETPTKSAKNALTTATFATTTTISHDDTG